MTRWRTSWVPSSSDLVNLSTDMVSGLSYMLVIPKILEYSEEQSGNIVHGVGLCFALFLTECLKCLSFCSCWIINQRTAIKFHAAISSFAFEQLLQFKSLTHITSGEAISFFTSDASSLFEGIYYAPMLLLTCSSLAACGTAACLILGPTALITVACYLLIIPFEVLLTRKTLKIQSCTSQVSDQRIWVTSEVLTCIKLIKMYTWEKPFAKAFTTVAALNPLRVSVFFVPFAITGLRNSKSAVERFKAFTTVAALNPLRVSVFFVPFAITGLRNSKSAVERFKKFFLQASPASYVQALQDPSNALIWEEASLLWQQICPGIVNKALEGTVLGICGPTGSSKSSLLPAILGEMHLLEGSVGVCGSLAYVPQQAWIIGGSIRENILMGGQYDKARYLQVLCCCSLNCDLEMLPFGDMTEIGEWGLNLSEGQKQRISLARAIYSNHQLYLLDDPLSTVEAHVGKHVFEECIKKMLRGKTVILVAHQLQGGLQGSTRTTEKPQAGGQAQATAEEEPLNHNAGLEHQLTKKEEMEEGSLSWRVYYRYIQDVGGCLTVMVFLLMVAIILLWTFNFCWLSYWLDQGSGTNCSRESNRTIADPGDILDNPQLPFYQLVYGLSTLVLICTAICSSGAFTKATRRASTALHNKLLSKV
ncbi:ATP-binding cassette transporter sub-family C member 11 [Heterocephalus glaber]|uniref:ATP-binding cassette transporter sub-family C member 11 n=1 Tax=Heterocephalus glaber TaxID=10181 RepID=G5BT78_HETGA|nr:ATP-binding cassette transporter sub-family C member 11 [Heterocephalus glaber]